MDEETDAAYFYFSWLQVPTQTLLAILLEFCAFLPEPIPSYPAKRKKSWIKMTLILIYALSSLVEISSQHSFQQTSKLYFIAGTLVISPVALLDMRLLFGIYIVVCKSAYTQYTRNQQRLLCTYLTRLRSDYTNELLCSQTHLVILPQPISHNQNPFRRHSETRRWYSAHCASFQGSLNCIRCCSPLHICTARYVASALIVNHHNHRSRDKNIRV